MPNEKTFSWRKLRYEAWVGLIALLASGILYTMVEIQVSLAERDVRQDHTEGEVVEIKTDVDGIKIVQGKLKDGQVALKARVFILEMVP